MREPTLERVHPAGLGGIQRIYRFANGWGASVIRTPFSYGGRNGKWELAVLRFKGEGIDDFDLSYEHPVSEGDVRGRLTEEEVDLLLNGIEATDENTVMLPLEEEREWLSLGDEDEEEDEEE